MVLRYKSLGILVVACVSCAARPAPSDRTGDVVVPPPVAPRTKLERAGEMIRLAGGTFNMPPQPYPLVPEHPETVASFEIGRTEVTTGSYRECVRAGGCTVPAGVQNVGDELRSVANCVEQLAAECNFPRTDREDHPINCVTFAQAEKYCRFRGARLPTEAEWEFAAIGTANRMNPWGDEVWDHSRANLCDDACSVEFSCPFVHVPRGISDRFTATAPVGSFPNGDTPEGIHDMAGNVWEWSVGQACPRGNEACEGSEHVLRGDAWSSAIGFFFRDTTAPDDARSDMGFRCAR